MAEQEFLAGLGFTGVTARLKRLSDVIMYNAREHYKFLELDIEPNMHLIFLLLKDADGPMSVTEMAARLKFSHPALIKITKKMQELGYVESLPHPEDGRKTLLGLTARAMDALPEFEAHWMRISSVVEDVFGNEFLLALEKAEHTTGESSFLERCNQSTKSETKHES